MQEHPRAAAEPSAHGRAGEAEEFHGLLRDLVRLHQFRERERTAYYGLTVSAAYALELLGALGAVSLNRIAAELFVDKSTASRIVGSLEDRGFLQRVVDPADRRALRLELTAAGLGLCREIHADAVWEMQTLLGSLPAEVRSTGPGFLRHLTRAAAAQAGVAAASSSLSATPEVQEQ